MSENNVSTAGDTQPLIVYLMSALQIKLRSVYFMLSVYPLFPAEMRQVRSSFNKYTVQHKIMYRLFYYPTGCNLLHLVLFNQCHLPTHVD